jgi:pteridine reductase
VAENASFVGKVALVTGGARRVGRAVALTLAEAGMDVAITYNESRGAALEVVKQIQGLGRRAVAIQADLARAEAATEIHAEFLRHFNRLDALVNNASMFAPSPLGSVTPEVFDQALAVNARTPLLLIQAFAERLGAHYQSGDPSSLGRIVNFVDIHVLGVPLKGFVAYNASKAALLEITMTLALDLAPRVTVNAIAPGVVAWPDFHSPEQRAEFMARVPLAREGHLQEAADAVLFLVRDANYCTGQVIKIDGGRLLS